MVREYSDDSSKTIKSCGYLSFVPIQAAGTGWTGEGRFFVRAGIGMVIIRTGQGSV
jgi:hypothetical protein